MSNSQEEDYKYFISQKDKFFKQYPGKFLVIKNKEIIGVFDDQVTAYTETTKENEPGTFVIQECSPESTDTQVFHSRIVTH